MTAMDLILGAEVHASAEVLAIARDDKNSHLM